MCKISANCVMLFSWANYIPKNLKNSLLPDGVFVVVYFLIVIYFFLEILTKKLCLKSMKIENINKIVQSCYSCPTLIWFLKRICWEFHLKSKSGNIWINPSQNKLRVQIFQKDYFHDFSPLSMPPLPPLIDDLQFLYKLTKYEKMLNIVKNSYTFAVTSAA